MFRIIFTCRAVGDFVTVYDIRHEGQIFFNFDLALAPLILVAVLACIIIPVLKCSVKYDYI